MAGLFDLSDVQEALSTDGSTSPTSPVVSILPSVAVKGAINFDDNSELAHVLSIGTATPSRIIDQSKFGADYQDALRLDDKVADLAAKISRASGITKRHLAVPYSEYRSNPNLNTVGAPSLNDRVALFEMHGPKLAQQAAEKAIADWGGDKSQITHLLTYSTSGMLCPGLDLRLIKSLGLSKTVKHFFTSYMGCHAGLIGWRPSTYIWQGQHNSNHAQAQPPEPGQPINNVIVATIFGDGASAMVVGARPTKRESPIYEIHRSATSYIDDCDEAITARVTEAGLRAGLQRNVPQLVGDAVDPFVRQLVGKLDYETELLWALHPGGRAIVDATEKGCKLSPTKLQVSRHILDQYGNMSAATVLFVLDQVRKDNPSTENGGKKWTLALTFGPGISIDGTLLRLL
eukprot:SM000271S10032  [mRNA]  locus=s271:99953:101814:- [translate_table: standard]